MSHPFIKSITFTPAPIAPVWPKRADGTNMKMGEMTKEQRREQIKASVERTAYEFSKLPERAFD